MPKVTDPPELNATAASILGFLQLSPMTGFNLMSAIENIIGDFWHVTKSQVYRELKLLAEHGFIETLATGARDSQPYRIMPAGQRAFQEWIAQTPSPGIIRMPIVLEIFFGGEVPFEKLREHIATMRAHHAERLRVYETFAPPEGTWPHETLRLGFMFQRMMIEWLDTLPKKALSGAFPPLPPLDEAPERPQGSTPKKREGAKKSPPPSAKKPARRR